MNTSDPPVQGPPGQPRVLRTSAGAFTLLRAVAVLLPLAGLAFAGAQAWNRAVGDAAEEMVRTLGMVHEQTLRTLETQVAVLSALDARIEDMPWDQIAGNESLTRFTRRLAEATPTVLTAGVVAPDGSIAVNSDAVQTAAGLRLSDRDYISALRPGAEIGRTFISATLVSRTTGGLVVHLSRARRGPDGRADGGVVTTGFDPRYFEAFFRAVAETRATGFTLARDDGFVLARFPNPVTREQERLANDDLILVVARDAVAGGPARVVRSGSLLVGFRMLAVRRAEAYPLLIAHSADPDVMRTAWLQQMAPVTVGALAATALLMLLIAQVQRRMAAERASLVRRTATAERGQAAAETRAELESRLRQTEKIAALGHLSAGVAHDFNNLLQSIVVSAETLTQPGLAAEEVRSIGALILRVGERGMALTRRMLDYARRDDQPGGGTDVVSSLRGLRELLARSLGQHYRLEFDLDAMEGLCARGHPAEFETVIVNLVANARDAMPGGGDIAIAVTGAEETRPREQSGLKPGRYLRVTVRDTGHGMDQTALGRAGEAFFTTKPPGHGTGLGLSMARGFARRAGGKLELASAEGQGTTVTLWLPAA